jgi:hypothetical protein
MKTLVNLDCTSSPVNLSLLHSRAHLLHFSMLDFDGRCISTLDYLSIGMSSFYVFSHPHKARIWVLDYYVNRWTNIDVIPILSAPFRTPSKKVSHPRPIMARKTMATTINTRMPIAQILFSSVPLTIMKGNYLLLV